LTTPCGLRVNRKDRPKWLAHVTGLQSLLPLDKAIAARLMTYYCSRAGDAWPAHATLARENNRCVRTVQRALARLHDHGLLQIISRKKEGRPNVCWPCWPDAGGKVVQLKEIR